MRIADCIAVRGCRHLVSFIGAALFIGIVGCASSGGDGGEQAAPNANANAGASANSQPSANVPAWVKAVPDWPGVAVYGVGAATFASEAEKAVAIRQADANARRDLAMTFGAGIEASIKTYASGIVADEGQISEESLSQDVMRVFTDQCVRGADVIRRWVARAPDAAGEWAVHALVVVDFDSIIDAVRAAAETSKAVEAVRRRAESMFADLPQKLETFQREQRRDAPFLGPAITGEDVFPPARKVAAVALGVPGPAWTRAVPSAPGVAFYGFGKGLAGDGDEARRGADARARIAVARRVETIVRRVVEAKAADAGISDAMAVTHDAWLAVQRSCIDDAPVIRRFTLPDRAADGECLVFALVEIDFRRVMDALRAAVLQSPGNGGDEARIRRAFANADEAAIIEQRYHADLASRPLPPPIAGEQVVNNAVGE